MVKPEDCYVDLYGFYLNCFFMIFLAAVSILPHMQMQRMDGKPSNGLQNSVR